MTFASLINPLGILLLIAAFFVIVRLATLLSRLSERVAELERRLGTSPRPAPVAVVATASAPAPTPAPALAAAAREVTPEDYAIVAAAVSTLLGAGARIVRISHQDSPGHSPAWSIEGRRSIYHSHNVRR
jgi:beta-phosphoglucomutase-like phosphatase (HAD superfamily)